MLSYVHRAPNLVTPPLFGGVWWVGRKYAPLTVFPPVDSNLSRSAPWHMGNVCHPAFLMDGWRLTLSFRCQPLFGNLGVGTAGNIPSYPLSFFRFLRTVERACMWTMFVASLSKRCLTLFFLFCDMGGDVDGNKKRKKHHDNRKHMTSNVRETWKRNCSSTKHSSQREIVF